MLILFRRIETIADVAHGADEMLVLATQLGAQTTDMHVHSAGAAVIVVAPHLLQQLRTREHAARMLHQILEQLELLVRQVDRMAMQAGRITVGIHHQIAGTDQAILVLHALLAGASGRAGRRIAPFGHQTQTPLHFGGGSGGHHHIGDAPLRIHHGETTLGENQHDRRGQSGRVNQAAQRFRGGQIVTRIKEKNGVLRHLHQARRIHRQNAHAVGQQRQRGKNGGRVASERHKRKIRHVSSLMFPITDAAIVHSVCVIGVSSIVTEVCGHLRLHLFILHTE